MCERSLYEENIGHASNAAQTQSENAVIGKTEDRRVDSCHGEKNMNMEEKNTLISLAV